MNCAHTGKCLHLVRIVPEQPSHAVCIDLSFVPSTGNLGRAQDFAAVVASVSSIVDAVILNAGQIERMASLFYGRGKARILARLDWTSAFREKGFPLPTHDIGYGSLADTSTAASLGADGVVVSYLLGYGDDMELASFDKLNLTARESWLEGLPLFVDVCPFGPAVTHERLDSVVEMAVSISVELGADSVFIPTVEEETLERLAGFCSVPLLLWSRNPETSPKTLLATRKSGIRGFILGREYLEHGEISQYVQPLIGRATDET